MSKPEDKYFKRKGEVLSTVRGTQRIGAGKKIGTPAKTSVGKQCAIRRRK